MIIILFILSSLNFYKNTPPPLHYLTEKIKEALDQGKYGCGIFTVLQKAL